MMLRLLFIPWLVLEKRAIQTFADRRTLPVAKILSGYKYLGAGRGTVKRVGRLP
jgi:hypothetical protein